MKPRKLDHPFAMQRLLPCGLAALALMAFSAGAPSWEAAAPLMHDTGLAATPVVDVGQPGAVTFDTPVTPRAAMSPEQAAWQRCVGAPARERHACFRELLIADDG